MTSATKSITYCLSTTLSSFDESILPCHSAVAGSPKIILGCPATIGRVPAIVGGSPAIVGKSHLMVKNHPFKEIKNFNN
jgi:hypothetical protein